MDRFLASHSLSCMLNEEEVLALLSQFSLGKLCKPTISYVQCL